MNRQSLQAKPGGSNCWRILLALSVAAAWADAGSAAEPAADIRPAIERGLAFLTKDAVTWKAERKCASCHHAPMAIWGLTEARRRGYAIDGAALAELTAWVVDKDDPAKVLPKQAAQTEIIVNQTPLLLSLGIAAAGDVKDEATRAGLAKFYSALLEKQRPDGSWGLQPKKWEPIGGVPEVMTSQALLSLASPLAVELVPASKDAREKGLAWLLAAPATDNLQALALKALLLKRLDRPATDWEPLVRQITALQKPDGGWSQTPEMASDAFATGQTLYVLAETGVKIEDPVIAKGQAFLVKSQTPAGSWPMVSRPNERDGKSAKNLSPITFAGTGWGVLGLVRTSPAAAASGASSAN